MMKFSYQNYYDKRLIIFGNLPYNISTQILAKWVKIKNLDKFCKKLILMFQKKLLIGLFQKKIRVIMGGYIYFLTGK